MVLWLREYEVDIGCVEVSVRQVAGARQVVLSSRQLLPLPEAEDYLVRRRRKEQEEDRARQEPADWSWDVYASKFPADQVAVARRLFDQIARYVEEHELPWTPVLRAWWLGYQRPGGFYVPVIGLHREKPIEFKVKIPDDPVRMGLEDPYPHLRSSWDAPNRQWGWEVVTVDGVPDVRGALDISRRYQPLTGPMPRPEISAATGDAA